MKNTRTTPTMADVARLAGVSQMTVSNCFKNPDRVVAATRQRVLDAATMLDYIPNLVAGNLAAGHSKIIAAVTPSIRNSNFAGMIMGLENELNAHGYHLIVSVAEGPEREYDHVRALIGRRVDGIVLTGVDRGTDTRRLLMRSDMPTVETWNLDGPFVDMGVGFSTRDAARDATQLMIDKGLRKIGVIGYETTRNTRFRERLEGFRDAMRAARLPDNLCAVVSRWTDFAGGRQALRDLIARDPGLEGVFCFTDVLAAGAIFECMQQGWKVPDRLAVVGYGDYEIAAHLPPGLTTIRTPGDEIGKQAARMIVGRYSGEADISQVVDVGYSVVSRGSV